jgi:acyl-CoA dehydrogenase
MDFTIPDELIDLKEHTARFVREEILPREHDPRLGPHGPSEDFRRELLTLAREAGLLSPHVGREWGGLGLDHRGKAIVFEAAGYAPLATIAMNIFAPGEANMHLLEQVADERQNEQWLRPLAAGDIRSCFMMTEPAPGAGADPSMLLTTARRAEGSNSGDFVIDGTKWLITGAVGADLAIIMAKNDSDPLGPAGATMFLTPMNAPGIHIERVLDTLDQYRCWAGSARGSAMRRRGLPRRASPIACAGSAPPDERTTSRPITRAAAPLSASPWASMKGSASCWPTTRWICTPAD